MANEAGVIAALIALLKADATLSAYVRNVYGKERQAILEFPQICVTPVTSTESEENFGKVNVIMNVNVSVFNQIPDADQHLAGTDYKDLMTIVNDVKKAIDADRFLSTTALYTKITGVAYDYEGFPDCGAHMTLEILFRQDIGVRT